MIARNGKLRLGSGAPCGCLPLCRVGRERLESHTDVTVATVRLTTSKWGVGALNGASPRSNGAGPRSNMAIFRRNIMDRGIWGNRPLRYINTVQGSAGLAESEPEAMVPTHVSRTRWHCIDTCTRPSTLHSSPS